MKKFGVLLWVIIIGIILLLGGLYIYKKSGAANGETESLLLAPIPTIGGDFKLIDQKGREKTLADYRHKYLLVYFGYSFCPDICPTGLQAITEAMNALGAKAKYVQPIFITVDPTRDTPAHLGLYMENFHPKFDALTGSEDAIREAMSAYKVYAAKAADPKGENTDYLVDHSSLIYLMDPNGHYLTHFTHATPGDHIADKVRSIIAQQRGK